MEYEQRVANDGLSVWIAGLNPSVLQVVRNSALDERLGRERMLFNAREAILRYQGNQASTAADSTTGPV
jgi:hypothetical protein